MKIRNLFLVYSLIVIFSLVVFNNFFNKPISQKRDMVKYFECINNIEHMINSDVSVMDIEQTYDCRILMSQDEQYMIELNNAYRDGNLVMDIQNISGCKVIFDDKASYYENEKQAIKVKVLIALTLIFAFGYVFIIYLNERVYKPFAEMNRFTSEIAKGNLDIPLSIHRGNIFNTYTESFDIMREEIKKARENELQAQRSKKELVAELSHDIKTPIATISANCELIEVLEKDEKILEKIKIIKNKTNMINQLVDNLFTATLEELEVLVVNSTEEESGEVLTCLEKGFTHCRENGNVIDIRLHGTVPKYLIYLDKLRFEQVIDNLIMNSVKYAGTDIDIYIDSCQEGIKIRFKDYGPGVDENEMALITEKFYRGINSKGQKGSGLGLYLVKFFMNGMKGDIQCYNDNGFVVELFLKKV